METSRRWFGTSRLARGEEVAIARTILVATNATVWAIDPVSGRAREAEGFTARRPSCLAAAPAPTGAENLACCGSEDAGLFRSEDGGLTWAPGGLSGEHVTAVAVSPADPDRVWAGTEPSAVWRSDDAGRRWKRCEGLLDLPSSSEWSFPPRPETHHVRWIACHPADPDRAWFAIEAGALVSTPDGGRTWEDRVPGGPHDTHEAAIHPSRAERLRVSAGDGYFESADGGRTWRSPQGGLEVTYLRSVAIVPGDPAVVVVSAASRPRSAYATGRSDGRLYRRAGEGLWKRVREGWPDPPSTIAPLLTPDPVDDSLLAADERGVHRSRDGGRSWERLTAYPAPPDWLRGLAVTGGG